MNQKVDYFIVGLGLAGSTLAWELIKRGKTVMVFDNPGKNQASLLAAGLFNPVTGKYLVKTWKADEVFPFIERFYSAAEASLRRKFFHLLPVFTPFSSLEEKNLWKKKIESGELKEYTRTFHETPAFEQQVNNPLGGVEIAHSGYLHVEHWITAVRNFLIARNAYSEGELNEEEISFQQGVVFKNFQADKIIFCNGLAANKSRWFSKLPIIPLKGEVLIVHIDSPIQYIFNRGAYIVPGAEEFTYSVGSTYDRPPFEEGITPRAFEILQSKLAELTPCPFKIIHQKWGIRPTTIDRRPVLGPHPDNKKIVLFNGLGTKGVSLAPYFAHHLADWLEGRAELLNEVNICRFKALYSR